MPSRLVATDGPPGTGKTTNIIRQAKDWPDDCAVITFTNDAANTVRKRAPGICAGTIYSLSWPFVKPFSSGKMARTAKRGGSSAYTTRRIHSLLDPALTAYEADAPSRQEKHIEGEMAPILHAWNGSGVPPLPLSELRAARDLKFILPIARWLAAGAPVPDSDRLSIIAIDEAQDISALELAAARALLKEDGIIYAYGDPGQSIFAKGKGILGKSLPPVWEEADETRLLSGGFRVGSPVAEAAARVLRSYYDRPASTFRAEHATYILDWETAQQPGTGLVLGYSRYMVAKTFRAWGLNSTAVTPNIAKANVELVLATGHAAKGGEADDVYLLPWSSTALDRLDRRDPDAVRLLYVMLTRAVKRLHIPRTLKARLYL